MKVFLFAFQTKGEEAAGQERRTHNKRRRMFIVRQQTKNWTPLHAHIYWDWETLIFKIVYWQMPTTILSWDVFGFKNLNDECQYHCWGLLLIKQISQKSKVKKTQDCSNKTMFFNHATDRNTNTRSGIANYWAIPPVSQGTTAKNQNWKSSGVRRQCQEKHVRIRAICKLEQISHIWQWPLYLVADD